MANCQHGLLAVLAVAVLLPAVSRPSSVQVTEYSPLISIAPNGCFFACPSNQTVTGPIVNGAFSQQLGTASAPNPKASLNASVSADGSTISASGATISYTGGNNPYNINVTSQLEINFTLSEAVNYSLQVTLPVSDQATATSEVSFYYVSTDSVVPIYSAVNENSVFNPPFSSTGLFQPGEYLISLSAVASGYGMARTVAEVSAGYSFDLQLTPVPLPDPVMLLLSGLGCLGALTRSRHPNCAPTHSSRALPGS
jgi:hypothetical protein